MVLAFGCRKNRGRECLGLGFYRFPSKNEDRRRRWSQVIRREDCQPTKYSRFCGDHITILSMVIVRSVDPIGSHN